MDHRSFSRPRGSTMHPTPRRCHGYSLIELLIVMVIVTILATVGVLMIGDRRASAVRSVMDEMEGVIYNAQKASFASSRDIFISTQGNWADETLILDGRPLQPPPVTADPPVAADLVPGDDARRVGAGSECFRSHAVRDRDHQSAGIVVNAGATAGWYAAALGGAPGLASVAPISTQPDFVAAIGNQIFIGAQQTFTVSGLSKRFPVGFSVIVVGLRNGAPVPNGPVGILLVPRNSSTIYKYYKADNSTVWRLL